MTPKRSERTRPLRAPSLQRAREGITTRIRSKRQAGGGFLRLVGPARPSLRPALRGLLVRRNGEDAKAGAGREARLEPAPVRRRAVLGVDEPAAQEHPGRASRGPGWIFHRALRGGVPIIPVFAPLPDVAVHVE